MPGKETTTTTADIKCKMANKMCEKSSVYVCVSYSRLENVHIKCQMKSERSIKATKSQQSVQ